MSFENNEYGSDNKGDKILRLEMEDGRHERIILSRRKSILSPNMKLEICSGDCDQENVPENDSCVFGGKLVGDPHSVVNVRGCDGEDVDVTIMSTKKDFGGTFFRKTKDGKIETMKQPFIAVNDMA